jgi:hypothetical protein
LNLLSCPVLSCPVLSCPVLSCPVLSVHPRTAYRIVFCIFKGASDFTTNDGITGGYYVRVSAPTLFVSLLILFAMIALVIGTIVLNKWKLTKPLG